MARMEREAGCGKQASGGAEKMRGEEDILRAPVRFARQLLAGVPYRTAVRITLFPKYDNRTMLANAPTPNAIQASSTSPNFRLESFSANMSINIRFPNDIQAAFTDPLLTKNSGHDCMERSRRPNSFALWANISTISPLRFLNALKNSQPPSDELTFKITPGLGGTSQRAITVGARVTFEQVYQFADDNDSIPIGGYAHTVGVSGGWMTAYTITLIFAFYLTTEIEQGAGHSALSSSFGLGVGRVLEIKIVTPGRPRTAGTCQNTDLFWALRGGGGEAFGMVVVSTHLVEQRIPSEVINMTFTPTATKLQAYFEILANNSTILGERERGRGGRINRAPTDLIHVNPRLSLATAHDAGLRSARAKNGTAATETLPSWSTFFTRTIPLRAQPSLPENRVPRQRLCIPRSVAAKPSHPTKSHPKKQLGGDAFPQRCGNAPPPNSTYPQKNFTPKKKSVAMRSTNHTTLESTSHSTL
ncbi:hypothetical protein B0H13DRAFT_2265761 [Mycena leptocephala]|nr:hypothetical protein B0H13DRAFT_2265761 [Mycena leptocephala]